MLEPLFSRLQLPTRTIQVIAVISFVILLPTPALATPTKAQATRSCMKQYLRCQSACKKQQEPKSILRCLNKRCSTAYHQCIDKVNHVKKAIKTAE